MYLCVCILLSCTVVWITPDDVRYDVASVVLVRNSKFKYMCILITSKELMKPFGGISDCPFIRETESTFLFHRLDSIS